MQAQPQAQPLRGFRTLLRKELLRFSKVAFQTVAAPILTSLLYLMIFAHVLENRVQVFERLGYTSFLAPGLVMSENVLANEGWTQAFIQGNTNSRAIKREALPEDMCGTLVYLCSSDSDFVTGQVLVVDGGSVTH